MTQHLRPAPLESVQYMKPLFPFLVSFFAAASSNTRDSRYVVIQVMVGEKASPQDIKTALLQKVSDAASRFVYRKLSVLEVSSPPVCYFIMKPMN